ncbi:MAG: GNAT family N-acetyltransferase [Chloroflexi bacterium]|nr:GNAT family N-acetyltransferase [Chloroflexota bacterium]
MICKRNFEIRACTESDVEAVLALWRHSSSPGSTDTAAAINARLARDDGLFLLASIEGTVIGSLIAGWDGWRGYFYRLVVDQAYRRRGIAAALVREGERRLSELGARRIYAAVLAYEEPAVEFWRAAGYELTSHVRPFAKDLSVGSR